MVREIYLQTYLFLFQVFYTLFSLLPLKKTIVFCTTYGENVEPLVKNIDRKKIKNVVVLTQQSSYSMFKNIPHTIIGEMDAKNPLKMIQAAFYLATAKVIICDNYFGTLAAMRIRKGVQVIQIWHALGALKKFGLMNENNKNRSLQAQKRFQRVYSSFNQVVVGSEAMISIFEQAFGTRNRTYLRYGVPRTDALIQLSKEENRFRMRQNLEKRYPILKGKKCILYTPTYRDGDVEKFNLKINIDQLKKQFQNEYVLLIKVHPVVNHVESLIETNFVCKVQHDENINELFCCVDILITDYSSVPFEFAAFEKPMIFYSYDLHSYNENPGLIPHYNEIIPGPLVYTTAELIEIIKNEAYDMEQIRRFKETWLLYCNGHATEKLINHIELIYNE